MSSKPLLDDLVKKYVGLIGVEKKKEFIRQNPDLLGPESDAILAGAIWRQKTEGAQALMQLARLELKRCREQGVESALSEDPPSRKDAPNPDLVRLVHAFMTAGNLDLMKAMIKRHPELLGREVDELLQQAGDERTAKALEQYRNLLNLCREIGVDNAFHEAARQQNETKTHNEVFDNIIALLESNSLMERERLIRSDNRLLSEDTRGFLSTFLEQETDFDNTRIRNCLILLEECYRDGIDAAFSRRWAASNVDDKQFKQNTLNESLSQLFDAERNSVKSTEANLAYIQLCEKWLRSPPEAADSVQIAMVKYSLGNAYLNVPPEIEPRSQDRAIEILEDAATLFPQEGNPEAYSAIVIAIANIYDSKSDGDLYANQNRAFKWLTSASNRLKEYKKSKTFLSVQVEIAHLMINWIGSFSDERREYALDNLNDALAQCNEETDEKDLFIINSALGRAYISRRSGNRHKNLARAIEHFNQALNRKNSTNETNTIILLNNLSTTQLELYNVEQSNSLVEQAIDNLHTALGLCNSETDFNLYASLLCNLAGSYELLPDTHPFNPVTRIPGYYMKALNLLSLESNPELFRKAATSLARFFAVRGRWEDAWRGYELALAACDFIRDMAFSRASKIKIMAEVHHVYEEAAYTLAKLDQVLRAIELAERGRAQFLAEQIKLRARRPKGVTDEIWDKYRTSSYNLVIADWEEATNRIDFQDWEEWYSKAFNGYEQAVEEVRKYDPAFCKEVGLEELQKSINNPQKCIVYFCITQFGSLAFLINCSTKSIPKVVEIPDFTEKNLNDLLFSSVDESGEFYVSGWLGGYAHSIKTKQRDKFLQWITEMEVTLNEIGKNLINPVKKELSSTIEQLILIPSGRLSVIPLHAARLDSNSDDTLWDHYELGYAPSVNMLAWCLSNNKEFNDTDKIYLTGNPKEDPLLHYAQFEVRQIAAYFSNTEIDYGQAVTRGRFVTGIKDASIIHIACHANFDWNRPRESGFSMSDGLLTLEELMIGEIVVEKLPGGAELAQFILCEKTKLAILSACETGMSDFFEGSPSEFIGIPGSLMLLGVPCTISSLWSVADISTALIMERFHQNLAAGNSCSNSLRSAAIWLKNLTAGELAQRFLNLKDENIAKNTLFYEILSATWRKFVAMEPHERPFSSYFYYAPFIATGAAWIQIFNNNDCNL